MVCESVSAASVWALTLCLCTILFIDRKYLNINSMQGVRTRTVDPR